jgi:hypothetical protein
MRRGNQGRIPGGNSEGEGAPDPRTRGRSRARQSRGRGVGRGHHRRSTRGRSRPARDEGGGRGCCQPSEPRRGRGHTRRSQGRGRTARVASMAADEEDGAGGECSGLEGLKRQRCEIFERKRSGAPANLWLGTFSPELGHHPGLKGLLVPVGGPTQD